MLKTDNRPADLPAHQLIRTPGGEELVVMSKADFDDLARHYGEAIASTNAALEKAAAAIRKLNSDLELEVDAEEDEGTARIVRETSGALALPLEAWDRIDAGESPIKVIRETRGRTQAAAAAATGISQAYLSKLEAGKAEGSIGVLKTLAEFLNVTVDDLLGRS